MTSLSSATRASVAFTLAVAGAARAGEAPAYTAEFLGGGAAASAMNQSGVVIGSMTAPGGIRGWVASSGSSLALLPLPPGNASSWANDINDGGVIAGAVSAFSSPDFFGEAATWTPDGAGGYTIELLGMLPGHVRSNATALNNVGDVVGYSFTGMFRLPVLFDAGGVQDLSATGIFDPAAINDQRVLVDNSFTVKRLDLDTMIVEDLGVPPGDYLATRSSAINESNQVAGLAILTTGTKCDRQAARFTDGIGWQIFSGCGSSNGAYDLNDQGDIVMRLNVAPWVRLEGLGSFPIEDLIVADVGHWFLVNSFGLAINNARQLAVWGSNPTTGENGTLLLSLETTRGDLDGDGVVGIQDLLILLADWGPCPDPCPPSCAADIDRDCQVDINDLLALLAAWS